MPTASTELVDELNVAADARGVVLSPQARDNLCSFISMLLVWRRSVGLVSQRAGKDIVGKHVEDSFALLHLLENGWRIVDLGSGAGFPGMVAAIVRRDVSALLVESARKKANFLRAVVRQVGLSNVRVTESRAERLATSDEFRGPFDLVVSRAVWEWSQFLRIAHGLVRPGGLVVAMKTPSAADVAKTRIQDGGRPDWCEAIRIEPYSLRGGEGRALVIARRCST